MDALRSLLLLLIPTRPPAGGGMDCPNPKRSAVTSDLPEDSLVEILARVPARSLCRSKCAAKAWRDIIEDPFHRKKLPQTLQGFFSITEEEDTCGLQIGYTSLLARSARLQIDPSLSFLKKLPEFENLTFLGICNGLLLFEHIQKSLGYVVCNPATKQWGAVPRCGRRPPPSTSKMHTGPMYLVFDPAVSSHFHLVQVQFVWGLDWEDGFMVVDGDYDDGEQGNGGYVHDYHGHHHQQHFDDEDSDDYDDDDDEDSDDYDDDDNEDEDDWSTSVIVYSSESGQWIHIRSGWDKYNLEAWCHLGWSAVLNGILHFIIYSSEKDQIAAVDVQGVVQKIIPAPIMAGTKRWPEPGYVAQSQGCLHYINRAFDAQLSVWVLEDYDTQKWVLKHSVSFMELFGKMNHRQSGAGRKDDYSVVAMHPDGNVVFLVQYWNRKLISYDMDHKLVSVIRTLENDDTSTINFVPYVPCFLESPALTNKH